MKKIKVKDIVNIAQKSHCSNHKNRPYEIIVYEEEETIILEYIKEKYFYSKKSIINKSELKKIKANLIDQNIDCIKTQNEMVIFINELHNIALNKSVYISVEEHIDELIILDKREHKDR